MPLFFGTRKHPKGPNPNSARWLQFDYSGSVFRLKVPPNTDRELPAVVGSPFRNIYDMSKFVKGEDLPNAPLVYQGGYRENWTYYGVPFIDGFLGSMSVYIALSHTDFHGNLFNPQHFESFVDLNIDHRHGPDSTMGGGERGRSFAPLNWQVANLNGHSWVHFEVEKPRARVRYCVWSTAISRSHVLKVGFDSQEHNAHNYCQAAFEETIQQIVSTFQITLSETSLQDKREAEEQWPDAKFSQTMPEKPWSIENRRILAAAATAETG